MKKWFDEQNYELKFDCLKKWICCNRAQNKLYKMPRNSRADINFRSFFQDFNMSKFVVYSSLLVFTMLFALKLDNDLSWSWWSIFVPLFVWKGIAGESNALFQADLLTKICQIWHCSILKSSWNCPRCKQTCLYPVMF